MKCIDIEPVLFESLMDPEDVKKIVSYATRASIWFSKISEGKGGREAKDRSVIVRYCGKLYSDSIEGKDVDVMDKFADFLKRKSENPLHPYNNKDTPFVAGGPIGRTGLKLMHAHLTRDLSVVYKIHGKENIFLDIYGIFSHADLGTGDPANIKKQKAMAQRFPAVSCG